MTQPDTTRWDDADTDEPELDVCWYCNVPTCEGDCENWRQAVMDDPYDNASEREVE